MTVIPSRSSAQYQDLYRDVVQEAAAGGATLMHHLVLSASAALQVREATTRDVRARNELANSAKQLRQWESELCKRYPQVLLEAFANHHSATKTKGTSPAELQFDELDLMDELQVQTSVILARTQQVAMMAAESSLADLNPLICSTLGLSSVQPDRNPLRPEIYVKALKEVIEQTNLPAATQLDWLSSMGVALGEALRELYLQLSLKLHSEGVASASYAILQMPMGPGAGRGNAQDGQYLSNGKAQSAAPMRPSVTRLHPGSMTPSVRHQHRDSSLLTLDKLRRLLAGEFDAPVAYNPLEAFAQHFVREFEGSAPPVEVPLPEFAATVPAALEALQEMQQVDHMVHRLEQRRGLAAGVAVAATSPVDVQRQTLHKQAKNIAQSLSLEVVTLMVDNIAMDVRLLEPIQQLVRNLEPALLRLALVDPRFFTDKRHPARLMVQELTHRSMAYACVGAAGFSGFLQGLEQVLVPLQSEAIESAEPFEKALAKLQEGWTCAARDSERQREEAVAALRHAEHRNLLASKIAHEIAARPDASQAPGVVMNFLCGPWSQVIAQARLSGSADSAPAEKYKVLIPDLLWSTNPALAFKNYAKLTRLVPPLLATLREGLDTIDYPTASTSEFLEALLGLHQLAFRAVRSAPDAPPEPVPQPTPPIDALVHALKDGDPWVAPQEAKVSNLMEFSDVLPERTETPDMLAQTPATERMTGDVAAENQIEHRVDVMDLPLGSWLELWVNDVWMRTQLTWSSPHGTLFLFTSSSGTPQSMTRRSFDKLIGIGKLRVISGSPMVDGALNAVAQQAMRNSVEAHRENI